MTLIEALQNLDIQLVPGSVYNFEADGCQIELRVRNSATRQAEPMDLEADTMLDAWVEFPMGPGKPVTKITRIAPPLPDVPEIPSDDEVS